MHPDHDLISRCLNHERASQKIFYEKFASVMYGICLRYAASVTEAQDILQTGFMYVFCNLHQFRYEGSLEGWVKKTIIHAALNFWKKNAKFRLEIELKEIDDVATFSVDALSIISEKELLAIIQDLSEGSRVVFNLAAIEGHRHKEIAAMLGITEEASKSRFSRAKRLIIKQLKEMETERLKKRE
ncbi:MAG: sigma-70 family RNA polymerase sigma factor [Bacteroidota bacterium]